MSENIRREALKIIKKKYKYAMIGERLYRDLVDGIARFIGVDPDIVEQSIAAERLYNKLKYELEKIAEKYIKNRYGEK